MKNSDLDENTSIKKSNQRGWQSLRGEDRHSSNHNPNVPSVSRNLSNSFFQLNPRKRDSGSNMNNLKLKEAKLDQSLENKNLIVFSSAWVVVVLQLKYSLNIAARFCLLLPLCSEISLNNKFDRIRSHYPSDWGGVNQPGRKKEEIYKKVAQPTIRQIINSFKIWESWLG